MHARVVSVVLVAVVASARADNHKLFDGYTLKAANHRVDVVNGKRVATILVGGDVTDVKIDAKAKKVTITRDFDCKSDVEDGFTAAALESRLVNYESLVLHRKKDWTNAAKGFEKAVKLDAAWRIPAFNLASAHVLLRANTSALAAIAPWLTSEPVATYAQVASDPELQPLLTTPQLAAVRATKPGTAKQLPDGHAALYSPEKKLVAVYVPSEGYLSCSAPGYVALHDAATGKLVGKLADAACKANKAERDKRIAQVVKILVDLGFSGTPSEAPTEEVKHEGRRDEKRLGRFGNKLGLVTNKKGTVNVLRAGKFVAEIPVPWGQYVRFVLLSALDTIVVSSYTPSDLCAHTDVDVFVLPATKP